MAEGDGLRASASYYAQCAAEMQEDAKLVDETFICTETHEEDGFLLRKGKRYWRNSGKIFEQPNDSRMWMPKQWNFPERSKI